MWVIIGAIPFALPLAVQKYMESRDQKRLAKGEVEKYERLQRPSQTFQSSNGWTSSWNKAANTPAMQAITNHHGFNAATVEAN